MPGGFGEEEILGGLEQILDINNLIPLLRNLRILDPIRLVCFITIRICLSSFTSSLGVRVA